MANEILWQPSKVQIEKANITKFIKSLNQAYDLHLADYKSLHDFSINNPEKFWDSVWNYAGIIGEKGDKIFENQHNIEKATWFADSKINFAENLFYRDDEHPALVFWGENLYKRKISYKQLKNQVASLAAYLRDQGVKPRDVVAGFMPNMPEAVIAMLATASIGAVWTSCSPDFGKQGVLDRFGQVKPKVLISANAYFYNGKSHDCLGKITSISQELPSIKKLLVVPYASDAKAERSDVDFYPEVMTEYAAGELQFARMDFNEPLYILYSSGTTGKPKCIVHGIGGTLLQHVKEHLLHVNLKPEDKIFYFTTCGWMMWNWLVSSLCVGATLILYDGSPFYPDANILFNYIDKENITIFGTSAKYIDVLRKENMDFTKSHKLVSLHTILSTGSVLVPASFDFVYDKIKPAVCLSSISGGTDIISCFALGCPILPVRRGELQCKGLGMRVEVFNDKGDALIGEKGELVCTAAFPSMPIYFWDDADGQKYHNAYFAKFANVWHHGDFVRETETGGLVFYGRSDAILNPGGVRIGTAEIYRQVEKLDEVIESIVIGQSFADDVRVILFVKLATGVSLDEELINRIKSKIRNNTSPRHVPNKVLAVNDIPRTKSGKIVELAVRKVVHGEKLDNLEALDNPESLEQFKNLKELKC